MTLTKEELKNIAIQNGVVSMEEIEDGVVTLQELKDNGLSTRILIQ